jgi:hypothetical protein
MSGAATRTFETPGCAEVSNEVEECWRATERPEPEEAHIQRVAALTQAEELAKENISQLNTEAR